MADEDLMLEVGGEQVSLAQLAGVNMDDVAEVRGSTFAAGAFKFAVDIAKLAVMGKGNDAKAGVQFKFKCTDVLSLVDASKDAETIIGKFHTETCFLTDPMEGLGRTKAFMADTGFKGSGSLQTLLEGFVGHEFKCVITNNADKNDKDIIYANIGLNIGRWKVAPADGELKVAA